MILSPVDAFSAYVGSSARESPQLNQTVYDETYETNVRDEADGAHESASALKRKIKYV